MLRIDAANFQRNFQRFLMRFSKPFFCEGALRDRNTRDLYSNNLRAVGPNYAQLKKKQNRKQDNKQDTGIKTRYINNQSKHPCPNMLDRSFQLLISLPCMFINSALPRETISLRRCNHLPLPYPVGQGLLMLLRFPDCFRKTLFTNSFIPANPCCLRKL